MKFPDIDPVIISIGPIDIHWYAFAYVVGILIGWYYCDQLIKRNYAHGITKENLDDFISWLILSIIIGGRLGYVIFYDPVKYLAAPLEILKTYKGGMSFHGGMIGVLIASLAFCKKNKVNFFHLIDLIATATPIALFLGRIANFINGELYGRVTHLPWAMIFPHSDMLPRHPSQLYEAFLEGIILFLILHYQVIYKLALKNRGLLTGYFLSFYALFRIIVEFIREPDEKLGYFAQYFTMGQMLSIPMLLVGIFLLLKAKNAYRS
ncbi:MAG: prolipoprotein diacylglyceryl transferase [Rickettsiaceae bacterium]|nr:prolipoprotein diacylglyceryl transferase [Rickettsiaceae bacterium]